MRIARPYKPEEIRKRRQRSVEAAALAALARNAFAPTRARGREERY